MTRWEIIKTLRKHSSLSNDRVLAYNQKRIAKIVGYVLFILGIFYLIFLSVMLALIANSSTRETAAELMFGIMPFILTIDFFSRFAMQQTPSQQIKPYILLPLGKYTCIDAFIFNSITSYGNLIWMALFVPYCIMSIIFVEGFWAAIAFLLAVYLLIIVNSQWYMLSRTLINRKYWWWILPLAGYAIIYSPLFIGSNAGFKRFFEIYGAMGEGATHWSLLVFGGILLLLAILVAINRRVQYFCVYGELAHVETTEIKHVSEFRQLDRFGEIGEYIKLEIKSIMRNKNIRKGFISANIIIFMFSLLISFTDIYQGGMTKFLAVYNFALYGVMILVRVMCYEGNYIDCLMVHKENIISLLKAKYFFYTALLLLPMLLMLPTVFMEKCSLLMLIAIMLLVGGPVHAAFLYMAVFNKQTLPLNEKFIGKGAIENSFLMVGVEIAAFTMPLILIILFPTLMGETMGAIVLIALSLAVVVSYRLWIRDIYRRMMKRRYENLESFRSSR